MYHSLSIAGWLLCVLGIIAGAGWWFVRSLKRSDDPARFLFKWLLTLLATGGLIGFIKWIGYNVAGAFAVPFACVAYGVIMSFLWAPHIARALARPLTSMYDGGDEEADPEPFYSVAHAKIKQGHYQEAAFAIKEQLLRFPNDFYGQSLLAQLQAEHLNDLPGAQLTIERLAAQPGQPRKRIAFAFGQLADWHLKMAQDVEAARQAFEQVIGLFPDTEEAQWAYQRIAHLSTTKQLLEAHDRPVIRVPHGIENLGLRADAASVVKKPVEDPAATAADLVKHLDQYPFDLQAREELACLYAAFYHRLDLALDQMEQIVQAPHQPSKAVVHCLNVIANLQVRYGADEAAARQTLQRIIDLNPDLPAAELARQRLARLHLEMRVHEPGQVVKMGDYEQNLGLKQDRPKV